MSIIDPIAPTSNESDTETRVIALTEGSDVKEENLELQPLVAWVNGRFSRNKQKRQIDETRWLEAYRNFRGLYDPSVKFSNEEQSKIFIKVTKTKVLAAVAQIGDILFAGNKFPIGIEATLVPVGIEDTVNIELNDKLPEDKQSSVGARAELLGPLKKMLSEAMLGKVKKGPGLTPTSATYEPAKMAAAKMEKKIHDQLDESDASKHLRYLSLEMALFGTGIMKGPFSIDKEYPKWSETGEYIPEKKEIPRIASVSIWNFYPDADAKNMPECEGVIERHKLSRHQMNELKRRPMFRKESIDLAIADGTRYTPEYWEAILEDNNSNTLIERFEVLEYWGMITGDVARDAGMDIPKELEDLDEFQINAWICNNQILRLVLNPYTPNHIPYYAVPYELSPYSFFGIGVAENMADTQDLMNGTLRLTVDNLALSGNTILEVNEGNLVAGQDMKLFPGKIFRTTGAPGQSIHGIEIPNVTQQLLMVYDKARQLTDEATNMPSYAHGGTGVAGVGRTASGMSMLMGAAAQSVKAIIRNIDDFFLAPCGKNLFAWNMQFDFDEDIVGDLEVIARGTESLMRNEIRSQRLLQFMQTGLQNPVTAPLVKADYILRELAKSLDLDEEKVVNDQRAMMIQAQMIKELGDAMGIARPGGAGGGQAPGAGDPTGNGGGNIAPGNAPTPGAAGFTGAGGGANGGQQPQQQQAPQQ